MELMDIEEVRQRLDIAEKTASAVIDKAAQYDNAVVGLGFVGFFALWTGVEHDIPRWSALATVGLEAVSLSMFITWNIMQMLWRHWAMSRVVRVLGEDGDRDLAFADRLAEAQTVNQRRSANLLRVWQPVFYTSIATGLAGALLLAGVAASQAIKDAGPSRSVTHTTAR